MANKIIKYAALTNNIFKVMLTYRVSFFIMTLGVAIKLLVFYFFWKAVYVSEKLIAGMSFSDMITYLCVSAVVSNLIGFFFVEGGIAGKIRDGTIANELVFPMDYQVKKLFETIGMIGMRGLITGLLTFIIGFFFLGISLPPDIFSGVAFLISVALAQTIEQSMGFCTGMAAFFTTNLFGSIMTRRMITDFFSGALVPLDFFPAVLKSISAYLPFQAVVYIPVSIYLGKIRGTNICSALLLQIFWAVLLWGLGTFIWSRAVKYLETQGG